MRYYKGNFNDNCEELTILRNFRDKYVSSEDIDHYYETAPIIVNAINELENSSEIFKQIYINVIKVCVEKIKLGDYQTAYNLYKESTLLLEQRFAKPKLLRKFVKTLKKKDKKTINKKRFIFNESFYLLVICSRMLLSNIDLNIDQDTVFSVNPS